MLIATYLTFGAAVLFGVYLIAVAGWLLLAVGAASILAGVQQLAHDANLLFYASEEAREGRSAFTEKRPPDFSRFPHRP